MRFKHGKNLVLKDKKSIFIDKTVVIGDNVVIYENNRLEGNTIIGDNVVLMPGNHIIDGVIGANSTVNQSQIQQASCGTNCKIGPWSRLRPNSILKDNVHIGNFVEIKNSVIGNGTKANHLAYVGDADVGDNCNIGCGAIFVNYNGKIKQRTTIGNNCFIGSNTNVIAPVSVADNVYVCAGTNLTGDLKNDDFVIGRVKQVVKENRAHEYLKVFFKEEE